MTLKSPSATLRTNLTIIRGDVLSLPDLLEVLDGSLWLMEILPKCLFFSSEQNKACF